MIFVCWFVHYAYVCLACLILQLVNVWPLNISLNAFAFINVMDDHINLCPHQVGSN